MTIAERVLRRWKTAADPRRPRWMPDGTPEIRPKGTDLVFYPHESGGRYGLIAFMGKQSAPFHNYTYGSRKQDRDKAMEQLTKNRLEYFQRKEEDSARRKEFKTSLQVGDILYTSWGYDQTNVDFYEVTKVRGDKGIVVREIGANDVAGPGDPNMKLVPIPGDHQGPEIRAMVTIGDRAKIKGHGASKWSGGPVYATGPYGGH